MRLGFIFAFILAMYGMDAKTRFKLHESKTRFSSDFAFVSIHGRILSDAKLHHQCPKPPDCPAGGAIR